MMELLKKILDMILEFFKNEAPVPAPEAPKPAPAPIPESRLEEGSVGKDVEAVQQKLKALGYHVDVDGEYGPQTKAAVTAFQKDNGIGQTGIVGAQTKKALEEKKATAPQGLPTQAVMRKAADIAATECAKRLSWQGLSSEAEKYLAPIRKALGVPSARFPWCACFVTWCARQAGGVIPDVLVGNLTIAYVPAWESWAKSKGFWHSSREKDFNPQKGDIVIFDWGSDGVGDHIGLVESYKPGSTQVVCLEGNTSNEDNSNGNQTARRVRYWSNIRGFVRFPA